MGRLKRLAHFNLKEKLCSVTHTRFIEVHTLAVLVTVIQPGITAVTVTTTAVSTLSVVRLLIKIYLTPEAWLV